MFYIITCNEFHLKFQRDVSLLFILKWGNPTAPENYSDKYMSFKTQKMITR